MTKRKLPMNTDVFTYYNANPKNKHVGDCVVRAIATATGLSYDDVFTGLYQRGLKYKTGFDYEGNFEPYMEKELGLIRHKQARKEDNTKYSVAEFCRFYLEDGHPPIVAKVTGHHLICIKDRKVLDIWNSSYKTIGKWWTVEASIKK